jgi:hypothetical protein
VPATEENLWAAACLARATGRLHDNRAALEKSLDGWQRIGSRFEYACTLLLITGGAAQGQAELNALGCPPPTTANLPLRQRQVPAPTQEGLPYSCRHAASWKRMPRVWRAPDRTTETPCRTGAAVNPRWERIGRSRVVNTSPLPWGSAIAVPRD